MPKLSLKPKNVRDEVIFEVYDLSFENFHEQVGELKGKGSLKLNKGSYKVLAKDGDRTYRKVVLVDGSMTAIIDFADKYDPLEKKSGLKLIATLMLISLILAIIMYYLGIPEYLEALLLNL